MIRAVLVVVCLLLASGCGSKNPQAEIPAQSTKPSLLDEILASDNIVLRINAAQQDQPSDEWRDDSRGGRYNATRSQRASDLALKLLDTLPPRLRTLSAQQLVDALKVSPDGQEESFSGVAYYVYLIGNTMIMNELKAKPRSELEKLWNLRKDRRSIYTGDSGGMWTIGDLVTHHLLGAETNGQPIRTGTNQMSPPSGSRRN
jgi:hypothetical protein